MWKILRAVPSRTSPFILPQCLDKLRGRPLYPGTAGSFGAIKRLTGGLQHQIGKRALLSKTSEEPMDWQPPCFPTNHKVASPTPLVLEPAPLIEVNGSLLK